MKHIISLVLTLCLALSFTVTAYAAGKVNTAQENFVTLDSWGTTSYAYARIENVGDKPIEYSAGLFEVYDANGDTVTSSSYLNVYGKVLQPGEYTYVKSHASLDEPHSSADVDDYMLTVTAKNGSENRTRRFSCETRWLPDFPAYTYFTEDYMEATFTNTTDETLFDVSIAFALLDEEGNILYIENKDFGMTVGIPAGCSIVVRESVSKSLLEVYEAKGITPAKVDAYAYID